MIRHHLQTAANLLAVQPPEPAPGGAQNPFDGVTPDFAVFGVEFTEAWQKVLGGMWGLAFVAVAFGAIRAVVELQHAKRGGHQTSVLEHSESAKRSGLALAALAGLGIIFGAVVALF
ncbi:hypothetical protein [Alloactinosynnema sp. L-07]|uniref:hypothetical protein n=1 Tax=Alloactinosynnema sp. L-07 TaxID=1653480 RepID=UPI00065F0142|nr:hypothetical protein [Alloactinosynnema sp. L-07]CRK57000.1 hypothetical protein [Alloactinosynnema sp. L-07]